MEAVFAVQLANIKDFFILTALGTPIASIKV
jgi:hypothetical protein